MVAIRTASVPAATISVGGTPNADIIIGTGRSDDLSGDGDNDLIMGNGGSDYLHGGADDDRLFGGNGADTLRGGEGNDTLTGGRGSDRFVIDGNLAGNSFDTIMDFDVGRQLRAMTFDDQLVLENVGGKSVLFQQRGDDVDLFIGGIKMATFKGSQGALNAADLLGATQVIGDLPESIEIGTPAPDPISIVLITGIYSFDFSGWSVASAGDVDGDGLDDVIIGAPNAARDEFGFFAPGASYLVYGSALVANTTVDLAFLPPDRGVLIWGANQYDNSGYSVASAGDVDGDGFDDVIIGAPGADRDGASSSGASYLLFGDALAASGGMIELATLTPDQGVLIKGIDAQDGSGNPVASAGDVDGDGLDDVLIGADSADPAGETYLLYGSALATSGGTIDLATLTADQGVSIKGANQYDNSGVSASSAGDVDGDGLADVIIGASRANPDGDQYAGETYLLYGSALAASGGTIDLATLTLGQGVLIKGIDASDQSGYSVASAGDVDGDGFDDLIIGAFAADPYGQFDAGVSYVISGALLAAEMLGDGVYDLPDYVV